MELAHKARWAYVEAKKTGETIALTRRFIENATRAKDVADNYIYDEITAEDVRLLGRVIIKTTPEVVGRLAKWRAQRER